MSVASRRPTYRRVSRSIGVGDVWDDIRNYMEGTQTSACRASADQATQQMQVYRLDLAKNWHPTGYYSSDQVKQLVGQAQAVLNQASNTVETAMTHMPDKVEDEEYGGQHTLGIKKAEIQKHFMNGLQFIENVRTANASGIDLIDAPGLREYVMSCMRTAESATWAAAFTQCFQPWWASILAGVISALSALWELAKAIAGFIYKVGDLVYHIPDYAATLMSVLKWAIILGGGYYLAVRAEVVPDTFRIKGLI